MVQHGNPKTPPTSEPTHGGQCHEQPTAFTAIWPTANDVNNNQSSSVPTPNSNGSLPQFQASTPSQVSSMVIAPTIYYDKARNKYSTFRPPPNDGSAPQSQLQALPTTPIQSQTALAYNPRTPASANKKRLARDILRSLKPRLANGKRKRSESLVNPPTKRGRSLGISESQKTPETPSTVFAPASTSLHDVSSASHAQEPRMEDAQHNVVNHILSAPPTHQPTVQVPINHLPTPNSVPDATARIQEGDLEEEDSAKEALVPHPAVPKPIQAPVSPHHSSHIQQLEAGPSEAKVPLFLPSPSPPSVASFADKHYEDVIDVDSRNESMDAMERSASHPIAKQSPNRKESKTEVYVLVPPTPAWVRHAKAKEQRALKTHRRRQSPKPRKITEQEDIVVDSEEEEDPIGKWNAPKRAYNRAASQRQVLNRRQPKGKISPLSMWTWPLTFVLT